MNENIDPNLSITRGGTVLSIKNANPKMSGQFTCRAINSAGSDSFNYDVQVQVPPKVSGGRFGDEKIKMNLKNIFYAKISSYSHLKMITSFLNI